ncbi:MAG TPA: aminoacyl-tRNA hydrolase [Candidatus Moranbacteria bacterium]|nr:aminoacyl-tRNA hydrolase [Candidatus Moranbacteria bacterium]
MLAIIGLGNPGKKYEHTRHNVGFMMADRIKNAYHFSDFVFNKSFDAEMSELSANLEKVLLVKPRTFMNKSGESVRKIMAFHKDKIAPENIIVIHDDIDLPLGECKIANNSTSAGHNGVQDIIEKIGTKNFKRIRIGIANEKLRNPIDPSDFVLQKFSEEELEKIFGKISENVLREIEKFF